MEPITTKTKIIRWALGALIALVVIFGLAASVMDTEEESCNVETSYQQTTSPF